MVTILKRELAAYFKSPIGYIFLMVFYAFAGYFFYATVLLAGQASLQMVFSNLVTITLFTLPILTMRTFSEEKRNKTDQALLTAPISLAGIVIGKFFAALAVYTVGLLITLIFALIMSFFAPIAWTLILSDFIAQVLLAGAIIAIGVFISSLTENQVIAAVGSFAAALGLSVVSALSNLISSEPLKKFLAGLSFYERYGKFTTGLFDFSSIVFFITVICLFSYLTVRVLDRRRWS